MIMIMFILFFVISLFIAVVSRFVERRRLKTGLGVAGSIGMVVFGLFAIFRCFTIKAGIHTRNPFAAIEKMSIKTQEIKETMNVPSKEGLTVALEVSLLYHLSPELAPRIYREVGPDYTEVVIVPQFRSVTRGVTSLYDAKALYTSQRDSVASLLASDLDRAVNKRGIVVESTPIRQLTLPENLSKAIEEKLKAEQESQRMQFVLTKEKQEADRKAIEATGIANFQKIVMQGISEQLLKWKGIEATEKLAASPNTKVIVIGNTSTQGLPLIFDGK